jgi:hypothetical protein
MNDLGAERLEAGSLRPRLTGCRAAAAAAAAAAFIPAVGYILCQQRILLPPTAPRPPDAAPDAALPPGVPLPLLWLLLLLCLALRGPVEAVEVLLLLLTLA